MSIRIWSCDTISISSHQFWIFDNDLHHRVLKKLNRSLFEFSFWCSILYRLPRPSITIKTLLSFLELDFLIQYVHLSKFWKFIKARKIGRAVFKSETQTIRLERSSRRKSIKFSMQTYRKLFSSELCLSESESNPSSYPFTKNWSEISHFMHPIRHRKVLLTEGPSVLIL